eukprot:m.63615 g.63615  ORF g.63615 m.63615 type:complete len:51 (-) comp11590_c0_seq3:105-257(-)
MRGSERFHHLPHVSFCGPVAWCVIPNKTQKGAAKKEIKQQGKYTNNSIKV